MKRIIILISFLAALLAGNDIHAQSGLTAEQKEAIKAKLSQIVDEVIESSEKMDAAAASRNYLDSPEFLAVNTDGSIVDHAGFTKANADFYSSLSSLKFSTKKLDYRFLTKSLVLLTWVGSADIVLKTTGQRMMIDPYVATVLCSKRGKEWKIIYSHETAAPPAEVKAEN